MTETDIADIRKLIAEEAANSKAEKEKAEVAAKQEKCKYDFTYLAFAGVLHPQSLSKRSNGNYMISISENDRKYLIEICVK